MAKQQGVNLQYFQDKAQNANRKEKLLLNEDGSEFIMYHPVFSKTKRTALLQELLKTVGYCNENSIKHFDSEFEVIQYLQFLMVKYFTDIKGMLDDADYYTHVEVMKQLTDIDFIDLVFNEAFDKNEVKKLTDEYYLVYDRLNLVIDELEKTTAQKTQQEKNAQKLKEKASKAVK